MAPERVAANLVILVAAILQAAAGVALLLRTVRAARIALLGAGRRVA